MNSTHGYWINGVDEKRPSFFVRKTQHNVDMLKVGHIVELAGSGKRRIVRITSTQDGDFLIVNVAGDNLDPLRDGWPNKFRVLP